MFKVNNRNSRSRCDKCSKVTIKTPKRRLRSRTVLIPSLINFSSTFTDGDIVKTINDSVQIKLMDMTKQAFTLKKLW